MSVFYDLIFAVLSVIYLPVYLFRRKFHRGFKERLGILPARMYLDRPVWIHAVSVGEVMAIRGLLEALRARCPGKKFVISTVTPAGNKVARTIVKGSDFVLYLPLDFGFIVRKVIDKINPCLFILAETEIWPNLISCLHKKGIPVVVVNARISDRSFKGYRAIGFFVKPILRKISLFCTQTRRDAERLARLGADGDAIRFAGNLKFDIRAGAQKPALEIKEKLGLKAQDRLLVAGSTHPGEEPIILGAYKELLPEFKDLRLLIAPRHTQRSSEIAGLIRRSGFEPVMVSVLDKDHSVPAGAVFVLDTVGQLLAFYSGADIVFVGGSLIKKGGHNILEPAFLAKPVLFGPQMFNFRDIAELFLENQASVMVRDQDALVKEVRDLLANPARAQGLGRKARDLVLQNQGVTERHLEYIFKYCRYLEDGNKKD